MTKQEIDQLAKFTKRLRFLIPLVIFLIVILFFPILVLWKSGEFDRFESVILRQQSGRANVYGAAFSNFNKNYKLGFVLLREPEIIVLGTSRALPFRKELFRKPSEFYNASLGVRKLRQVEQFLKKVPNKSKPKVVILSLDQNFFNDKYDSTIPDSYDEELTNDYTPISAIRDRWIEIYLDYFYYHKFSLKKILINSENNVGLSAIANGNGFRHDGSYAQASFMADPIKNGEPGFKSTYKRIREGNARFEYGERISTERIKELESLLKYCKQNNIYLITFLPPYAHEVYEKMIGLKKEYGYFISLYPTISPVFERYQFPLFDYGDIANLSLEDMTMLDGSHPSEVNSVKILSEIAKKDEVLKQYVDHEYLDLLLKESKSPYAVLPTSN